MFKNIVRPVLTLLSFSFLLTACMDTEGTGSDNQSCSVRDEAAFSRDVAIIKAAAANTVFSKSTVEISPCGHMTVRSNSGTRARANLDSVYAKIGSPSWQIAIAVRSLTILGSG